MRWISFKGVRASMVPSAILLVPFLANAQDAGKFYAGKTITLLMPSGPGGGYDAYARLVSRHIGRHIPGNPTILVQGMPGAGGLNERERWRHPLRPAGYYPLFEKKRFPKGVVRLWQINA